jgi:hypothetical protein
VIRSELSGSRARGSPSEVDGFNSSGCIEGGITRDSGCGSESGFSNVCGVPVEGVSGADEENGAGDRLGLIVAGAGVRLVIVDPTAPAGAALYVVAGL